MPAPRRYDAETRARAVRMYQDRLRDHGESKLEDHRQVGAMLGINPATLRKENAELRRANEILETASAFFGSAGRARNLQAPEGPGEHWLDLT